jgi:hypothetical protein
MLTHPTLEKLQALRLSGMVKGLEEQLQMTGLEDLGFVERLGLLVDREMTERESRRLKDRLAKARLRQAAAVEDVDCERRAAWIGLCFWRFVRASGSASASTSWSPARPAELLDGGGSLRLRFRPFLTFQDRKSRLRSGLRSTKRVSKRA